MMLGGVGNLLMAVFAMTLPPTPPERSQQEGEHKTWRERGVLFTSAPLVVFLIIAMLACVPSMAYNNFANPFLDYCQYPAPAALMTPEGVTPPPYNWTVSWLVPASVGLITATTLTLAFTLLRNVGGIAWGNRADD